VYNLARSAANRVVRPAAVGTAHRHSQL